MQSHSKYEKEPYLQMSEVQMSKASVPWGEEGADLRILHTHIPRKDPVQDPQGEEQHEVQEEILKCNHI